MRRALACPSLSKQIVFSRNPAEIFGRTVAVLFAVLMLAGCSTSKPVVEAKPVASLEDLIASIPPIELSLQNLVYSVDRDMRAAMPVGWVAIDPLALDNPDIFAAACDPDYSMIVVFAIVPPDRVVADGYGEAGIAGLMKIHARERVNQVGFGLAEVIDGGEFAIGRRRFGRYLYTTDDGQTLSRVALFATGANIYECTISQLPLSEAELPSRERLANIHGIILSGIEW